MLPGRKSCRNFAVKFTEAKNFFGSSTMALSMEGREVSEVEEIRILDTIRGKQ